MSATGDERSIILWPDITFVDEYKSLQSTDVGWNKININYHFKYISIWLEVGR